MLRIKILSQVPNTYKINTQTMWVGGIVLHYLHLSSTSSFAFVFSFCASGGNFKRASFVYCHPHCVRVCTGAPTTARQGKPRHDTRRRRTTTTQLEDDAIKWQLIFCDDHQLYRRVRSLPFILQRNFLVVVGGWWLKFPCCHLTTTTKTITTTGKNYYYYETGDDAKNSSKSRL